MDSSDKTNPEFWRSQITPESREIAKRAGKLRENAIEAAKSVCPTEPETQETGVFIHFVMLNRLRPVYRTKSGKEFLLES